MGGIIIWGQWCLNHRGLNPWRSGAGVLGKAGYICGKRFTYHLVILLLCNLQLLCPVKQSPALCSSALGKCWSQFSFCTRCVTGCAAAVMCKPLTNFLILLKIVHRAVEEFFDCAYNSFGIGFLLFRTLDSPVNLGRKEPHKGLFSVLASHIHESLKHSRLV